MAVANKVLDSERKMVGLPQRTDNPMSNVTGDDQLFKSFLITPQEPFEIANFAIEKMIPDENGNLVPGIVNYKQAVPKLVATMALGNLNSKEVALARLFVEISRRCAWYGFQNLAITYYLKLVHLNITSQSFQSQLLRQILTETVSVNRREESMTGTRDFTGEKDDKIKGFIDKWKNKAGDNNSAVAGQGVQGYHQMGLK